MTSGESNVKARASPALPSALAPTRVATSSHGSPTRMCEELRSADVHNTDCGDGEVVMGSLDVKVPNPIAIEVEPLAVVLGLRDDCNAVGLTDLGGKITWYEVHLAVPG